MNLYTLQDAINATARFVENGSGACDRDTMIDRVNEACDRLLQVGDWPHSMMIVRARVDNWTFPLPNELEAIRAINIDNNPSTVNSPYFRFMASGPGEERSWCGTGYKDIDEMGLYPLMYDLPSIEEPAGCRETDRTFTVDGLNIMAFSTSPADVNQCITLQGLDKYNAALGATGAAFTPSEQVRITPWDGGSEGALTAEITNYPTSTRLYRQITAWSKPETAGHVSLYAVEPTTARMWFLCKAGPYETRPFWRRYRLRGQNCSASNILIYGKMASRKLRALDDILPIQNIPAIKSLVQAIELENKQQLNQAVEFEANAIRLLTNQKSNHDSQGFNVQLIDHDVDLMGASVSRYISR